MHSLIKNSFPFRAQQKLSEIQETRSNEGSNCIPSPRIGLTSWISVDKSKNQIIFKKLNQEKQEAVKKLIRLEEENTELKEQIKNLIFENRTLVLKHESLKENFNSFKLSIAGRDIYREN